MSKQFGDIDLWPSQISNDPAHGPATAYATWRPTMRYSSGVRGELSASACA